MITIRCYARFALATYPCVISFRLQFGDLFVPFQQGLARLRQLLGEGGEFLRTTIGHRALEQYIRVRQHCIEETCVSVESRNFETGNEKP